jgi:hypothetical protein
LADGNDDVIFAVPPTAANMLSHRGRELSPIRDASPPPGIGLGELESFALEFTRGLPRCASSPLRGRNEEGGSAVLCNKAAAGAFNNLPRPRDPPPLPAPTRGGGCANVIGSVQCSRR